MPCDERVVRAERAYADDGISRVRVDVRDRREIEVHAGRRELGAERGRDPLGELDVVDDTERAVAGVGAARCSLESGDVAALLVDRDHGVGLLGEEIARQRCQLLAALDVPGVEHDPSEALGQPAQHPVGRPRPLEAGKDAGRGEPLELARHALTAPAVRPNAIFRCTRRKKMTTGIAVSVEAAMRPPQSVARLVP